MNATTSTTEKRSGGVQTIERTFLILETLAQNGGIMSLSALASTSGLPLPTIHRLVRSLVDIGYVRQERTRHYALGPRLIQLGESSASLLSVWARPHLAMLAAKLGESSNLAVLDAGRVVYVAQEQSTHSMRMFTEVGRSVDPHCTAVGKAILATMSDVEVVEILRRNGMERKTENTITDMDTFMRSLDEIRQRGYAMDEGEQEIGVRCVAVAVPGSVSRLGLSVSGPAARMTEELVFSAAELLKQASNSLAEELA